MKNRSCEWCQAGLVGRSDKKYCSISCKNAYHKYLRAEARSVASETDKILHRNRSILFELIGDNSHQKTTTYKELAKRNFKFEYYTGSYINAKGKRYHVVYDFTWIKFKNGKVIIYKRTDS